MLKHNFSKKTMNIVEKNKTKNQLNMIKACNHSSYEFLEYLKENKAFTNEELENIKNLQSHLLNLNVIFTNMTDNL